MAEEFLEILKQITAKEPKELTKDEIVFLKARRLYLSDDEKEKFAEILKSEEIKLEIRKRGRSKKK